MRQIRHFAWDKFLDKWDKLKRLSLKFSTNGTSGTRFFGVVPPLVPVKTLDITMFSLYWDKWDKNLPIEGLKIEFRDLYHTFCRLSACVPIYAREVVPRPTHGVHHA